MIVDPLLRYQGDFSPALRTDLDVTSVRLSGDERHLFSRIDGHTNLRQLASLVGLSPMVVAATLLRLEAKGVIHRPPDSAALSDAEIAGVLDVGSVSSESGEASPAARRINTVHEADLIGVGRYAGIIFSRELLEEINDLPMALRKELIWCDEKHESIDAFRMFDVSPLASAKAIRKSVNNRLRLFHPDTYFEHNLGSFGPYVLRHSGRLARVAEVMLDDSARDALKEQLEAEGRLDDALSPEMAAEKARLDKLRAARRLKKNPMFRRIAQAKTFYQDAMNHAEAKKFIKAHNAIKTALTFDPSNPVYGEVEERFAKRAGDERAERHVKAAEFNEGVGRWDRAAGAWAHAAKSAPHRPEFWAKSAAMLLREGEDLRMASDMVDRALEIEPENPAFLRVQMNVFDAAGMAAKAQRVAERILEIDPTQADVADRLRKSKRSTP